MTQKRSNRLQIASAFQNVESLRSAYLGLDVPASLLARADEVIE
jgi:hypothetical protein